MDSFPTGQLADSLFESVYDIIFFFLGIIIRAGVADVCGLVASVGRLGGCVAATPLSPELLA